MDRIIGFVQMTRLAKSVVGTVLLAAASGSIVYGVAALLFLLFSFAFNDWVDAPKDAVGHPHRAIPSGKLTRNEAFGIWLTLFVFGIAWAALFLQEYLLSFAVIYLFSVAYSFHLKPFVPVLATPVWSAAIAILFVQPFTQNILFFLAAGALMYSYELMLDYRDRRADKEFCATPTAANLLGAHTPAVSGVFVITSIALFGIAFF